MNNIRHMSVVEKEVLVGVLSLRDLMKSLTQEGTSRVRDVLIEVLKEPILPGCLNAFCIDLLPRGDFCRRTGYMGAARDTMKRF